MNSVDLIKQAELNREIEAAIERMPIKQRTIREIVGDPIGRVTVPIKEMGHMAKEEKNDTAVCRVCGYVGIRYEMNSEQLCHECRRAKQSNERNSQELKRLKFFPNY